MKKIFANNDSIVFRTGIFLGFILLIIITLALLNMIFYFSNRRIISKAERVGIPVAVLAAYMIDEIDDINSNALEYILGESEEKSEFEQNKRDFIDYLNRFNESGKFIDSNINKIEDLFYKYTIGLRSGVFDLYKPEDEYWAQERVIVLEKYAVDKLHNILNDLKAVNTNNISGIKYNLELADEAGDIIRDLQVYVGGDPLGKENFFSDTQDFEKFLALLKPLERSPYGKSKLIEVDAYYKVIRNGGVEIFSGYNPSSKIQAIENIELLEQELLNELERMLDYIGNQANNEIYSYLNDVRYKNNIFFIISLFSLVIIITLSIFFLKYFNSSIFNPIKKITGSIDYLVRGEKNLELELSCYKGEIRDFVKVFKVLKEELIEREIYENALKLEKEKLELVHESKNKLLFNTINEVKRLITTIFNTGNLDTKKDQNVKGLIEFIDNVSDYSKFETNKFKLNNSEVDLRSLSEDVNSFFLTKVKKKGIDIRFEVTSNIPDIMILDGIRLKKVMVSIIDNAIKFTEGGYISVKINSIAGSAEDLRELIITIQDSGIGIPEDLQNNVFNAFILDNKETSLGLAISSKIINMMGGYFTLHSQEGVGSTFNLHIPDVKIASLSFKDDSIYLNEDIQFSGSSILIAVDENSNAKIIKGYLSCYKLNLIFVSSGQEVIDISRLNQPDLILIDMSMPMLNGIDTLEVISNDDILKDIPKIAITSTESIYDKKNILTGCDGFITKPISKKELIEELCRLLPINSELNNLLTIGDIKRIDCKQITIWSKKLEHLLITKNFNELISISNIMYKEAEKHGIRNFVFWSIEIKEASESHNFCAVKKLIKLFLDLTSEIL